MTPSPDTDLSALQGDLLTWAAALRSIGDLVEQVGRAQVEQVRSPPALVRMIADFEALGQLGRRWTQGLRQELVATVPGGIEAYAASFRAHATAALEALEGSDEAEVRSRTGQELAILDRELGEHLARTKAVDRDLIQFTTALRETVRAIESNGTQAVDEVDLDEARLNRILAELNQLIGASTNQKTQVDFLLIGQGGSRTADVLANLNPGTFLVRTGYKFWRMLGGRDPGEELRKRIEALRRDRDAMSDEQRRVAGLRLIRRQIAPLADVGRDAVHASAQIVNFWAVFQTRQESVASAIARSGAAAIVERARMHLNAGARAWEQLAAYARSLKT